MLTKLLIKLIRERSGGSAAIIGLTIFAVLGFVGLSIEVGQWYLERRAMQSATDSAALAAGYVMYEKQSTSSSNDNDILAAARRDAARNGYDHADPDIDVSVSHAGSNVTVTMTKTEDPFFASFFTDGDTIIRRQAVANVASVNGYCMLGLSPTCKDTVKINGNNNMTLTNCPIMSNSCHSQSAAKAQGSAAVTTPSFSVCGSFTPGSGTLTMDPNINGGQVLNGAQPIPDPLGAKPECSDDATCSAIMGSCGPLPAGKNTQALADASPVPGNKCYNDMKFSGGKFYTLESNKNYYTNGNIESKTGSGATVTGSGVTIHMGPDSQLNITKGNFTMSPPTTGTYADILFFQSRSADLADCTSTKHSIEHGGKMTGTIYIPNQEVQLNSNSAVGGAGCLRIVAQILELNGSSNITSSCPANAGTTFTVNAPKLTE